MTYPPPLVPTIATFFPAGTVKLALSKTVLLLSYLNDTFSNLSSPAIESSRLVPSFDVMNDRIYELSYLKLAFQEAERKHGVHVGQSLTELSVYTAEEIKWHRKLEKKAIDHDKITDSVCS